VAHRQGTIIESTKDAVCLLTDVAMQSDRNVIQKENEKKLEYKKFKYGNSANGEYETLRHTAITAEREL
jgi:hypothetical protein